MARGTIKLPEDKYQEHNQRREELGLSWSEYIDAQAETLTKALKQALLSEFEENTTYNETTALVPTDIATLVYPSDLPQEDRPTVVLKHADGELYRLRPGEPTDSAKVAVRYEFDAGWYRHHERKPTSLADGLTWIADELNFGIRRGGEPATLLDDHSLRDRELIEIEPLDQGGILVTQPDHLPIVLHRCDDTYWRLRSKSADSQDSVVGSQYVIERTEDYWGDWTEVSQLHPADNAPPGAAAKFAKQVGIEALDTVPSAANLRATLDEHAFWFDEADHPDMPDAIQERAAIQSNTVLFEHETPDDLNFSR
jgi:hypothetical protein